MTLLPFKGLIQYTQWVIQQSVTALTVDSWCHSYPIKTQHSTVFRPILCLCHCSLLGDGWRRYVLRLFVRAWASRESLLAQYFTSCLGNFTKFTTLAHFGTNTHWLDFEFKRSKKSKVMATTWTNMVKKAEHRRLFVEFYLVLPSIRLQRNCCRLSEIVYNHCRVQQKVCQF